jgi:hypothetical protein
MYSGEVGHCFQPEASLCSDAMSAGIPIQRWPPHRFDDGLVWLLTGRLSSSRERLGLSRILQS